MSNSTSAGIPPKIEIYTRRYCGFCTRAKMILDGKGLSYTEHTIDGDSNARQAMINRANGRYTVPQIFINDQPIGGCQELMQLEQSGDLDHLLNSP